MTSLLSWELVLWFITSISLSHPPDFHIIGHHCPHSGKYYFDLKSVFLSCLFIYLIAEWISYVCKSACTKMWNYSTILQKKVFCLQKTIFLNMFLLFYIFFVCLDAVNKRSFRFRFILRTTAFNIQFPYEYWSLKQVPASDTNIDVNPS